MDTQTFTLTPLERDALESWCRVHCRKYHHDDPSPQLIFGPPTGVGVPVFVRCGQELCPDHTETDITDYGSW